MDLENLLSGGDLRSIWKSNEVVKLIVNQEKFNMLFRILYNPERKIVMRAADAIDKITIHQPEYLKPHIAAILTLCGNAIHKELKWHLALIVPRLSLSRQDQKSNFQTLTQWARSKKESKIVRVNSMQALSELAKDNPGFQHDFNLTLSKLEKENVPSLNARIKKLKNEWQH